MSDKKSLRAHLRARRDAAAGTNPIASPAAFHEALRAGIVVASYAPIAGEANPAAFEESVLAAGGLIALPYVVDRATPLRFLHRPTGSVLVRGPFGLLNPQSDWPVMTPDIILTPLVGFDRRGQRLGQGAGHYDRAFQAFPNAWRIGIAWALQEVATLPVDPWDVPLHAIVTEREWIDAA